MIRHAIAAFHFTPPLRRYCDSFCFRFHIISLMTPPFAGCRQVSAYAGCCVIFTPRLTGRLFIFAVSLSRLLLYFSMPPLRCRL
jgi:hypothetical protein